jgi:hypothetical protein
MARLRQLSGKCLLHAIAVIAICIPAISTAATKNGFAIDDPLVPAREIRSGGPGKDGIPALMNPVFVDAGNATFLSDRDRVLGISHNGVKRAYPIRILNYHEIVNDVLDGEAVVISYCPLCGSGMAFSSTLHNIRFVFGVSGLLYNSDVLMYDRQTMSLWSQLKSQAISGPMKGERLEALPVSHTSWQDWKARYPDTEVLSTETGYRRNYRVDPYPNYDSSGKIYFPVNHSSKLYKRKMVAMGLEIDGEFKVYPFDELKKSPPRFVDDFQGKEFEVLFDEKNKTARILDENNIEIPTTLAFWFAWYAFHPESEVFTAASLSDQS